MEGCDQIISSKDGWTVVTCCGTTTTYSQNGVIKSQVNYRAVECPVESLSGEGGSEGAQVWAWAIGAIMLIVWVIGVVWKIVRVVRRCRNRRNSGE